MTGGNYLCDPVKDIHTHNKKSMEKIFTHMILNALSKNRQALFCIHRRDGKKTFNRLDSKSDKKYYHISASMMICNISFQSSNRFEDYICISSQLPELFIIILLPLAIGALRTHSYIQMSLIISASGTIFLMDLSLHQICRQLGRQRTHSR